MKKERMIYGLTLGLILNWMVHGEVWAVIYFSAVMCGVLIYYRSVKLEQIFESALIRFVMILSACLCFSKELGILEASGWLMICAASSALTQRIHSSEEVFLYRLSIVNMALLPGLLIVVLFCVKGSEIGVSLLMMILALFQPSGLPLVHPMDSFERTKTTVTK